MNIMTKLIFLLCCMVVALGLAIGVQTDCAGAESAKQPIKMPNAIRKQQAQPRSGKPEDESLFKKMFSPRKHKYQRRLLTDVEGLADSMAIKTTINL